jgi:hypothetical protein
MFVSVAAAFTKKAIERTIKRKYASLGKDGMNQTRSE